MPSDLKASYTKMTGLVKEQKLFDGAETFLAPAL